MARRTKIARRNLSTTIRMGASHYDVTCVDKDTGESYTLDLSDGSHAKLKKANGYQLHSVASVLCDLHGIKKGRQVIRKPPTAKKEKDRSKAKVITEGVMDFMAARRVGLDHAIAAA